MTGYLHPGYAAALAEIGRPVLLPESQGWLLERNIPCTADDDAMGCYPLFGCESWKGLAADLDGYRNQFITVSLVADPFGGHDETLLRSLFDHVIPFKAHFIADLGKPFLSFVSSTHRKFARRALRALTVEFCPNPLAWLDAWVLLYDELKRRHGISGMRAFSRESFARQLAVPGLVMFRAAEGAETVGLDLWYVQGEVAQAHLAAFSPRGYELQASYGLKLFIFEFFRDKVRWLNLGGGAGVDSSTKDGLTAFKRGWASGTRTAWFCGRVLQPERYQALVRALGATSGGYFPAYRQGEFA